MVHNTIRSMAGGMLLLIALVTASSGCVHTAAPPPAKVPITTWTNSIGMRLVRLSGGTFRMGDPTLASEGDVIHQVTVSPFWIGQFEVTNSEYDLFRKRKRPQESLGNRQPAYNVPWIDAMKFCQWLSKKEGRGYRLPTEAEWEYACRGGLDQKKYPWGNEDPTGRVTMGTATTTPVGTYPPNAFGLYDMAGNVQEWVWDWFSEEYYAKSPTLNPQGPPKTEGKLANSPKGEDRWKIVRGSSHLFFEGGCGEREPWPLHIEPVATGFRVVMEVEKKPS